MGGEEGSNWLGGEGGFLQGEMGVVVPSGAGEKLKISSFMGMGEEEDAPILDSS